MNEAIQKQLEERLRWLEEAQRHPWTARYLLLARECAALRRLCAEAAEWMEMILDGDYAPGHCVECQKLDRLKAAAEGKDVVA